MGHDYFVANHNSDNSVTVGTPTTKPRAGKPGAPQKIALTLANLPKKKDSVGATWPRTPSKIDPQVSPFPRSPHVSTPADPATLLT